MHHPSSISTSFFLLGDFSVVAVSVGWHPKPNTALQEHPMIPQCKPCVPKRCSIGRLPRAVLREGQDYRYWPRRVCILHRRLGIVYGFCVQCTAEDAARCGFKSVVIFRDWNWGGGPPRDSGGNRRGYQRGWRPRWLLSQGRSSRRRWTRRVLLSRATYPLSLRHCSCTR